MSETSTRICTYCKTEKIWIWNGERLKDKSKIYEDASHHRWSGRRCPDCEKQRVVKSLKCDGFQRQLILSNLMDQGFEVISNTLPFKVSKNDKNYQVGIVYAATKESKISIDQELDSDCDFYAVVFQSVRLCSKEQLAQLQPHVASRHSETRRGISGRTGDLSSGVYPEELHTHIL